MYRGKNPKALLTIRLILQGFMEELQNKAYEDICITGLCQRADVSRQAFYNIFQTKEEAMSRECQIKQMTRKEKEALVER